LLESRPNPLVPIPTLSRNKYIQVFQSNDTGSTGFLNGMQAKNILLQTGLPPATLAKVWSLSDVDQDGRLSLEEFVIAMHLCDLAKLGQALPAALPAELHPSRSRGSSNASSSSAQSQLPPMPLIGGGGGPGSVQPVPDVTVALNTATSNGGGGGGQDSPPSQAKSKQPANTFEDKLRENFEKGNAVLEAKRQALKEQEEREKREREEKERLEQEKRQKIKEEQERRRMQELEKQMERQRLIDQQREEEHRKAIEQREKARNELIRQQRIEWEKQKKQELEQQRIKLQELLCTLKAKDKNLEYDMQTLNDKIAAYKTKISDSQATLNELNTRLEETRRSSALKQVEVERAERELNEYAVKLNKLAQEKLRLVEQQTNLNQDSPFAEEYRRDSMTLKAKQSSVQELKTNLESIENQINSTRTQLEMRKHELEQTRSDESELRRENARLEHLVEMKRSTVMGIPFVPPVSSSAATTNGHAVMKQSESTHSALSPKINPTQAVNSTTGASPLVKTSQSTSNIRSNTPKGKLNLNLRIVKANSALQPILMSTPNLY
jgi:hypothetical protein